MDGTVMMTVKSRVQSGLPQECPSCGEVLPRGEAREQRNVQEREDAAEAPSTCHADSIRAQVCVFVCVKGQVPVVKLLNDNTKPEDVQTCKTGR